MVEVFHEMIITKICYLKMIGFIIQSKSIDLFILKHSKNIIPPQQLSCIYGPII